MENLLTKIIETVTDRVEGTVLGQRISAPETYTPEILVRVPRSENRDSYGITTEHMAGEDTWYAYECSCLTNKGIPVYFGLVLSYSCLSEYIVESKSLKLYLNSFNMEKMGEEVWDSEQNYIGTVQKDLKALLGVDVFAFKLEIAQFEDLEFMSINAMVSEDIECNEFEENPELLKVVESDGEYKTYSFQGFRSNCKITHAPDWSSVYIITKGNFEVSIDSLFKYLVSFRNENHFHEEAVEMIYNSLYNAFQPEYLWVRANFVRRGGLDINPTRYNKADTEHFPSISRTLYQ